MKLRLSELKSHFKAETWKKGAKLIQEKRVFIDSINTGYLEDREDPVCDVHARVAGKTAKDMEQKVQLLLEEGQGLVTARCGCPEFQRGYYGYYSTGRCVHIAAAVQAFLEYQKETPVLTGTQKSVSAMIDAYVDASILEILSDKKEEKISLEPTLERGGTKGTCLSFRVGRDKKYVIKDLAGFVNRMEGKEVFSYGKNLEFMHSVENFEEESKPMLGYLISKIKESMGLINRINETHYGNYYGQRSTLPDKRYLFLTTSGMDELFSLMEGKNILYEDKTGEGMGKGKLLFRKGNPRISLSVSPREEAGMFAGISLVSQPVTCLFGERHCYLLKEGSLYQADESYSEAMQPFLKILARAAGQKIEIKKDRFHDFYSQVLGKISDYVELEEKEPGRLRENLPPEASFQYFVDYTEHNIEVRTAACYKEQKFNPYKKTGGEDIRNYPEEAKAVLRLRKYAPYLDTERQINHCNGEEELIFQFLDEGLESLEENGEVHISDSLGNLKVKPSPQVSVGVSLRSGLLDFEVQSDEIDFAELSGILKSYHLKKKYHRLKNGDFLKIEEGSMEFLSEISEGLMLTPKQLEKGKVKLPAYRALYVDKVLKESEGISYDRNQKFKSLLRNFKAVSDSDFEIPGELRKVLRNYQKYGYRWLRLLDSYGFGGILADDMGLGKTIQVITLLLAEKQEGGTGMSLIVCPASLVYNWESEINRFAPSLQVRTIAGTAQERQEMLSDLSGAEVLVTSYDLLKRDLEAYENLEFRYEVIDEAQFIKNQVTQGAKAVKAIQAKTRFALTGTPIENRLSELWSIFDYLMPGFLYTYEKFKKEMETPVAKKKDEAVMERLKKLVGPFILRRIKSDVLKDLPEKIEEVTYAKMEKEQQLLYTAYVEKIRQGLTSQSQEEFGKNKLKILAELTRLRQICCDPALCYENYKGGSTKLSTCMELVKSAREAGHKILLFSQFTSMLAILQQELMKEGISFYEITGATPKEKRMRLVNQFNQDDTGVFLISLKAGGTGLNLTGADMVIHYDPWWNVAAQDQATDRAHRIGQKNRVTVYKMIVKGTIEEKILKLQESKRDLADQVINGETNQLSNMTKDDFMELLQEKE